jgi:hypothetical protein
MSVEIYKSGWVSFNNTIDSQIRNLIRFLSQNLKGATIMSITLQESDFTHYANNDLGIWPSLCDALGVNPHDVESISVTPTSAEFNPPEDPPAKEEKRGTPMH